MEQTYFVKKCLIQLFFILHFTPLMNCNYNFVNKQNYEIDLVYDYITGTNIYFPTPDNKTLVIYNINPYLSLQFTFKMYTNDTNLISAVKYTSLYFGLDLMIQNNDISTKNYRGDVVVCKLNKLGLECKDYAYDLKNNLYVDNTNGRKLKSKQNNLHIYLSIQISIIFLVISYNFQTLIEAF
jgi:hypothetical protein